MSFAANAVRSRHLLLLAVILLASVSARLVRAQESTRPGGYVWLDVDYQPLPFQDHDTIRDVMRSARVVSRRKIGRGVAGTEKLVLEHGDTRFHAAFRSVDESVRNQAPAGARRPTLYRDAAVFESAAYELSELLALHRVPPVVERRIDTQDGTLQIWMEEITPEVELIERGELRPPDVVRWHQQMQVMNAFDNLIANSDRNKGNLLIDRHWTLWFIDHTRAFRRSSRLPQPDRVTACERQLWTALRELDEQRIRQRLEPYLERQEISTLLLRRAKLVDHIQKLIDENGEAAVLFDLRPPEAEPADRND